MVSNVTNRLHQTRAEVASATAQVEDKDARIARLTAARTQAEEEMLAASDDTMTMVRDGVGVWMRGAHRWLVVA